MASIQIQRKSRRPRLPSASHAETTRFAPSSEEWQRIAEPFGIEFSQADRKQLVGIVETYFVTQPFEAAAPHVADAKKYLKDITTKANAFFQSLSPASNPSAADYVQQLIVRNFRDGQTRTPQAWTDIITTMAAFLAATDRAQNVLSRCMPGGGFIEGYAWCELIRKLEQFCHKRCLPTAASKGWHKSPRDGPSPFVAFVRNLQDVFPPKFRRHHHSDQALAKAIHNARDIIPGKARN